MNRFIKTDLWLGFLVMTGGLWAHVQSRGFGDSSRGYPMFLSALLIVIGLCLIVNVLREPGKHSDTLKVLFEKTRGPLLIAAVLVIWGILLSLNVGFILSSLLMLASILWLLGYRAKRSIIFATVSIVAIVFILFYVLFEVPIPLHKLVEQLLS